MKATLAVLYFFVVAAVTVLCLPASGSRSWTEITNHASKYWTEGRAQRARAYADTHDISYRILVSMFLHEIGPEGYEFGQKGIAENITLIYPQEDWNLVQGCRTIQKSAREFTKAYNRDWAAWRGTGAEFQDRYHSKFIGFVCRVGQQPSSGCADWIANVTARYDSIRRGELPKRARGMRIYR